MTHQVVYTVPARDHEVAVRHVHRAGHCLRGTAERPIYSLYATRYPY